MNAIMAVMLFPHSWQKFLHSVHLLSPRQTLSCLEVSQHSELGKYLTLNLSQVSSMFNVNMTGSTKNTSTMIVNEENNPLL